MENQICQLGLVAPLQGFLDLNNPVPKGPNTAYMLRGCLKSSMLDKLYFFKYFILFVKYLNFNPNWYQAHEYLHTVVLHFNFWFYCFLSNYFILYESIFFSSFLIKINWFQFGICTLTCMHSGFSMMMNCLTALIQTWIK